MDSSGRERSAKELSLRMLEIINRQEWHRLSEIMHEDCITEWPQSNELIRGYRNMREINENYPGDLNSDVPVRDVTFYEDDEGRYLLTPLFTAVRTEGAGDASTSTVRTEYPDGSVWYVVTIAKSREGKLSHIVQYFAPVYEPPAWRARWVEPIETGTGATRGEGG